jgi:ketosteroid isomerase-like protein
MSQENAERAKQGYVALNDAYRTGDFLPAIKEFCNPQVVIKPAGVLPEVGEVRGHDEFAAFLRRQAEAFEQLSIEPQEFIDAGDRVVVPIRLGGRARFTGLPVEFWLVQVLTLRNSKLLSVDVYTDMTEALEAAGLSE